MMEKDSVLSGCRVLDLTSEMGVFCTKLLSGLGADVIKVEPPEGDPMRQIGPFYHNSPHPEKSLFWFLYNVNKRSITLNIESVEGKEIFNRLAGNADFVVESFKPGYLESLGLGYEALSQINPRLIMTSITPFGQTGPYKDFKGSPLILEALSGHLFITGDADRPPVQPGFAAALMHAGSQAALGTMIAHYYRGISGEGQHVDVSIQESLEVQSRNSVVRWRGAGRMLVRSATGAHEEGQLRDCATYPCRDGYVVSYTVLIGTTGRAIRQWLADEGMAGDLGEEKWNPIFQQGAGPTKEELAHIQELFAALCQKYTKRELLEEAQSRRVTLSPVLTVKDVAEDPHLADRGYFITLEHPELKAAIHYPRFPFQMPESPLMMWRRAPLIGEHNEEVYVKELGFSPAELVILKEKGVI